MPKMTPYRRAVAITGTYEDRNGDEKKRYANIGTLFQYEDGGLCLKIDTVPVGEGWSGFVNFYEIEDKRDAEPKREESRRREPERGGGGYAQQSRGGSSGRERERSPRESFPADLDDDSIPFISRDGVL